MLQRTLDTSFDQVHTAIDSLELQPELSEIGTLLEVGGGIARVRGLPTLGAEALVRFPDGVLGLAVNLDEHELGIVLLDHGDRLTPGAQVQATGRQADTPVGEALIGRVIDATGRPLDDGGPLSINERQPVERPAPAIMERAPVSTPLESGIKAVDAMIPIGRGQRELIVGDRQSGKTTVAVDTIINQRDKDVLCIYCAIGQRGTAVARAVDALRSSGALEHSIVVSASGEDAPGLQYINALCGDGDGRILHATGPRCADRLRRSDPPRPRLSRAVAVAAPPTRP
ncbi:hypothetical protein U5801_25065 [Lamprobacter modestohalophilus]|uniref:hypothetical protein n=1 Tax=Lamprobacter modestohalophilus TaxID=1064514 RepID=UPI002ADEC9BE|nr:hypothetical protein [Lamprobacter modestohalophilus]MEA1053054.1 hypothetical protein [Lamprobacter modestohalophilus]